MKSKNYAGFVFIALIMSMFVSCDNSNTQAEMRAKELELLDNFIKANNITTKPTASGLYYLEVKAGTGDTIKVGDKVQVFYKTYLIDSTLVDASGNYEPLEFYAATKNNSSVVEGLNEAIKYMKKGTVANLIVPSQLGYGSSGNTSIGAFSTLLFEITVYKVYPATTK